MKKVGKQLSTAIGIILIMALLLSMTVFAEGGSADNSLSSLGVENGTVLQEVEYGVTVYDVTVAPGTTELRLNPVPTDANASIVSIEGTTLGEDGTTTVVITVQAENGDQFPYYLNVSTDQSATPVTEETTEAPQTETEPQTEAPQTENAQIQELEANNRRLSSQVDEYRSTNDMQMKIIYGLAALAVVLVFVIVNQILRNRDLKEDLKEIENHIDSHSKEKNGASDTYYTPQQGKGMPKYVPPVNNGTYQEETFRQTDKNTQQNMDKIPVKKQTRAEKKAAKAENKAMKKAGKYEQQAINEMAGNAVKRQPQNMMNNPAGNQINNQPIRQPQGNLNPQMMRQPQMGNNMPNQSMNMNGSAGGNMNHMGAYAGRAQQMNNSQVNTQTQAGPNHSQSFNDPSVPQEPVHAKVEVDMIDL